MKKLLLFLLVIPSFFSGCNPFEKKPVAQKGILDLASWNFANRGITSLDGEWEFYWKQRYSPADFKKDSLPVKKGYIIVPTSWNNQVIGGTRLTGQGYATYRLVMKGCPDEMMGIRIPDAYSTYKLWINGVCVAGNGVVSSNPAGEVPELRPEIRMFKSRTENELILQVSNFFLHQGGANSSTTLGTPEQIIHDRDVSAICNMFIIGMLVILCLYHICIFVLSRTDYIAFWFSLLCLFVALRCLVTGDKFILVLLPGFSPDIACRIEYAGVFGGGFYFLGKFICGLFPTAFSETVMKFILGTALIQFSFFVFLPTKIFTSWLNWYQATTVLAMIYYVAVIVKSVINKQRMAIGVLIVICSSFVFLINDILYAHLVINTGFLLSYGMPFLLLVQAYFIASRIGHALNAVEKLSVELNDANIHLEQKVIERTRELETEKKKTDDLLLNILPAETAEELKDKGHSKARTYSMVSVMFIDVAGFSHVTEVMGAASAIEEIDYCFSAFDNIVQKNGLEKIKTIGNVYLCAAGLPVPSLHHAEHIVTAARDIRQFMEQRKIEKNNTGDSSFNIKIGINIGPVVAGIVGTKKFAYDIWGDTVNTAARMQQHGEPWKINISGKTYELVKNKFNCTYRGKIEAKNKGEIDMYYVE